MPDTDLATKRRVWFQVFRSQNVPMYNILHKGEIHQVSAITAKDPQICQQHEEYERNLTHLSRSDWQDKIPNKDLIWSIVFILDYRPTWLGLGETLSNVDS